jgi:hypothetical protein
MILCFNHCIGLPVLDHMSAGPYRTPRRVSNIFFSRRGLPNMSAHARLREKFERESIDNL